MSKARNTLVSFGAFWLSLWTVPLLAFVFGRINGRITYGDSLLDAIAMGLMTSMGRAVAAACGGALVTFAAVGRAPERWALIVATLYVIDSPVRYGRWHIPPTAWDHLWLAVDLIWPGIACIAAAVITSRVARDRCRKHDTSTPN